MAQDLYSNLPPEIALQQQGLTRQQEMAKMLLAQGAQQNAGPAGQMVSGHYVPNSFFQNLQGPVNQLLGAYIGNKADEKSLKTAQALRDYYKEEAQGFAKAVKENPDEAYINYSSAYNPAIAKTATERMTRGEKWEKVDKLDNHGNTVTGFIDVNSSSPESTFRPLGVSKPAVSAAEAARLRDEGIPYGGGSYNTSSAVTTPASVPATNNGVVKTSSTAPASTVSTTPVVPTTNNAGNIPVTPIVNMSGISPKEQRAIKTKQLEDTQANVKNAYEVFSVVKQIEDTLPKAHGSGIGNIVGGAYNWFGADNPKNEADAQLKILGSKLLMQVPRFQGPQSDKDVATYKEAAGQIGDPTIPANVRMAALKTIKELNARYAPNLDWGLVKPTPLPNAPKTQASPAPAGVPADVWAVMTPQEKALWK